MSGILAVLPFLLFLKLIYLEKYLNMPPVQDRSGPDLAIQLYSTERLYQPGDIVRGRIIRRTAPSVSPMIIVAIVLSGRVKTKRLVDSFKSSGAHWQSSTSFESYVEYHLEASLVQQGNHGRQDGGLSFKEKTHQFFKTSRVPQLSFSLEVDLPEVVQLGTSLPIPFRVRIVPNRRQTSQGVLTNKSPPLKVRVQALKLALHAHTAVIAPSNFTTYTYSCQDRMKHYMIRFPGKTFRSSIASHGNRNPDKRITKESSEYQKDIFTSKGLEDKEGKGCNVGGVTDGASNISDPFYNTEYANISVDQKITSSVVHPDSSETPEHEELTGHEEKEENDFLVVMKSKSLADDEIPSISTAEERRPGPVSLSTDRDPQERQDQEVAPPLGSGDKNGNLPYAVELPSIPIEKKACTASKSSMSWTTSQNPNQGLLVLSVKWNDEDNEPIDLGALFDLKVERHGLIGRNKAWKRSDTIYPSFKTWSIKHTHTFKYKMTIEICGRAVKLAGESDVTLISPATS
ncbi:hypothetical protein N0V82_003197 [Gnomoniopsis sp. IMI 355080]|nr:hypothetical protein N0V82_003197 [Gnomoniopsis sp. IMI 355080]